MPPRSSSSRKRSPNKKNRPSKRRTSPKRHGSHGRRFGRTYRAIPDDFRLQTFKMEPVDKIVSGSRVLFEVPLPPGAQDSFHLCIVLTHADGRDEIMYNDVYQNYLVLELSGNQEREEVHEFYAVISKEKLQTPKILNKTNELANFGEGIEEEGGIVSTNISLNMVPDSIENLFKAQTNDQGITIEFDDEINVPPINEVVPGARVAIKVPHTRPEHALYLYHINKEDELKLLYPNRGRPYDGQHPENERFGGIYLRFSGEEPERFFAVMYPLAQKPPVSFVDTSFKKFNRKQAVKTINDLKPKNALVSSMFVLKKNPFAPGFRSL